MIAHFGATCTDSQNDPITDSKFTATPDSAIDTSVDGNSYTITFACTDGTNPAPTQTRTLTVLQDTNFPTITINEGNLYIDVDATAPNDLIAHFGATCTDSQNDPITDSKFTATPDSAIDTSVDGNSYTITFACTDGTNPAPTQTRTLTVQADNTPPPNTTPTPTPTPSTSTTNPSESIPPPPNTGSQIFVDLWHVQVKSPYGSGAVWETYLQEKDISGWESRGYEITKITFLKAGYYDVNGNFLYGFNEWKTIYLNSQNP